MNNKKKDSIYNDVIIIGAGPVGLFAAFELGMHGMKSLIIDANEKIGGQCSMLYAEKSIYDIPAIKNIKAQDLINNLIQQSEKFIEKIYLNHKVIDIKKKNGFFTIQTDKVNFVCKYVIFAIGSGLFEYNKIALHNAEQFENKSIFYSVNKKDDFCNKDIVILGGGDSAIDWCLELKDIAKSVTIVHRRDVFKAIHNNLQDAICSQKVNFKVPYQIDEIITNDSNEICAIKIKNFKDLNNTEIIKCDNILAFFGFKNDNSIASKIGLKVNAYGICVNKNLETNKKNIFAIGDCCYYNNKLKLIMTGFAESPIVAREIYKRINKKTASSEHSTSLFEDSNTSK